MCSFGLMFIATRFGNQRPQVESSAPISSVSPSLAWPPRKDSRLNLPGVVSRHLRDIRGVRLSAREIKDTRDALLPRIDADTLTRGGPQPLGERRISEKSRKVLDQLVNAAGLTEQRVLLVPQDFGDGPDVGGDDGLAGRHVLEQLDG